MRHERDHGERADQVAEVQRQAEIQFERIRHDRGFQREQDERERRVDERRDRRADVAEAGAAREQVHVDAVVGGVVADRQAGGEDDQADGDDGPERVLEAVVDGDGAADRFQHEEGDGAERRIGDAEHGPFAERARREAQRVILDRLVGDPGVVVAPDLDDAQRRFRITRGRMGGGRHVLARNDAVRRRFYAKNASKIQASRPKNPMRARSRPRLRTPVRRRDTRHPSRRTRRCGNAHPCA